MHARDDIDDIMYMKLYMSSRVPGVNKKLYTHMLDCKAMYTINNLRKYN